MTKGLSTIVCATTAALFIVPAFAAEKPLVGFITKSNDNPFFFKMLQGAKAAAEQDGLELRNLQAYSAEAQASAIETLVSAGAKGILIVPGDTTGRSRHRHRSSGVAGRRRRWDDRHKQCPGGRGHWRMGKADAWVRCGESQDRHA
jgi:hypothetical protein